MANRHTRVAPQIDADHLSSEHPIGYALLGHEELPFFRQLIDVRRSLPIYRAGRWVCYECRLESTGLAVMARHIVQAPGATAASADDLEQDGSNLAY
jgi:hypothetical protein